MSEMVDEASFGRRRVDLLLRVAAAQQSSALLLRTSGKEQAAREAELAALRIRFALDEPKTAARMLETALAVRETSGRSLLLDRLLDGAIALLGADLGNIQLPDSWSGGLRIAAHSGFGAPFLEHFATVRGDTSACGRAASRGATIVIGDVRADAAFEPHRAVADASGFRAVLSAPVTGSDGRLLAVVSTHFREPYDPSPQDLLLFGWYVDRVGGALARAA